MPRAASPRRYAQAVFQIAVEAGQLEEWSEELRVIAVALENADLSGLLDAPQVPVSAKVDTIKSALGDSVGPLAINLLSLLAVRDLSRLVPGILDEYSRLVDRHVGIERAEVVSAVPLDDVQVSRVSEVLAGIVGTRVRLDTRVDREMLGGLVAQVGDRVIDGSVRTRLQDMRRGIVGRKA